MIYTLSGTLQDKRDGFVLIDVQGVGYRVFMPRSILEKMPQIGEAVRVFCFMNVKEDGMELYGFLNEKERTCFEMLTSVSGVGPKTAMRILDIAPIAELAAAVQGGKADLLTKASGVGRKTAERVVVELKGKMGEWFDKDVASYLGSNIDIVEALANLGYHRMAIRDALQHIDPELSTLEDRLRAALKLLKK